MAYYLAIIDPDTKNANVKRGTLLSLQGHEYLNDVTEELARYIKSGFKLSDYTTVTTAFKLSHYTTVSPDPDLPGVMVCKVTGKPVMVNRGIMFTTDEWTEFLKKTWGV